MDGWTTQPTIPPSQTLHQQDQLIHLVFLRHQRGLEVGELVADNVHDSIQGPRLVVETAPRRDGDLLGLLLPEGLCWEALLQRCVLGFGSLDDAMEGGPLLGAGHVLRLGVGYGGWVATSSCAATAATAVVVVVVMEAKKDGSGCW